MRRAIAGILLLAPAGLAADASISYAPAAGISHPWLAIGSDPRLSAMGEAGAAAAKGVRALPANPAGLDLISDPELFFDHNEFDSAFGLRQETLAYGTRMGDGAAALGLQYFSMGDFQNRDLNGAITGASSDSGYAATLGYAQPFYGDSLRLGLGLSASQETVGASSGAFISGTLGLLYDPLPYLRLGLSATNLGLGGLSEGSAPSQYRLGAAWMPLGPKLQFAGEYNLAAGSQSSERLGAEWVYYPNCSLRAGWRFGDAGDANLDSGLSAGFGFRIGSLDLDYAYVPYGDFNQAHRIAATLNFTDGLFGPKVVIEAYGASQNAQAEYDDGMAAFNKRDWYLAKVSLNRALKIYPDLPNASKAQATLKIIDQKISDERGKGMSGQQKASYLKKVGEARAQAKSGEYAKARETLEVVLEFDPSMKEATDLMREISTMTAQKTSVLRKEAQTALEENDLRSAVVRLRQIRAMDPSDNESFDRLKRLQPRIILECKKLHRAGIDRYVTGDIDGAIRIWQGALDLDPSDSQGIKRDLDKAKKLIQLRAGG